MVAAIDAIQTVVLAAVTDVVAATVTGVDNSSPDKERVSLTLSLLLYKSSSIYLSSI